MSTIAKTLSATSLLALLAAITPGVKAHGYVEQISDGSNTWYGLQDDWRKPSGSPILATDYLIPSYNVDSSVIACGINPQAAQGLANVSPGTTLNIKWITHADSTDQPQKHWTHNEGTHRAFIGACIGSCSSTDPTQVEWVELGGQYVGWQTYNGQSWPVSVLAAGNTWSVTIPDLPSGDYLFRDELTALHFSTNPYSDYDPSTQHGSGTEFYPTCMAIHVNNNGAGSFDMSQVMKFPGAYTVNQPGHYNPDLWANPASVILSSVNTFARTGSTPNSGGSTSDSGNTGSNTNTGGSTSGNTGDTSTTPANNSSTPPASGAACKSGSRRKRSAKFARRSGHQKRNH